MTKYLINRILRSLFSVIMVVAIVMILIYSCLDRTLIFMTDPLYSKMNSNGKTVYMMQQWERYGYLDYIPYTDWLMDKVKAETEAKLAEQGVDSKIEVVRREKKARPRKKG